MSIKRLSLIVGVAVGLLNGLAAFAEAKPVKEALSPLNILPLNIRNKTAVEIDAIDANERFFEEAIPAEASPAEVSPAGAVSAEIIEITEADGTTVILPPGYDERQTYPALVLMPYTNRTALHMFNWGMYEAYRQVEESFVVIMPPGQGSSANWSGGGWEALVNEYEGYVQQDLMPVVEKYAVDPEQLAIGGFSLGGDLSWTLSLRNPNLFSGAIVMGSMSNYRNAQNAAVLASNDFRYFMVMGGYDGNRGSMYDALDTLDSHNIDYHYEEVSHAGHGDLPEQMQANMFLSAMDYIVSTSE